jgi:hypothetical protein
MILFFAFLVLVGAVPFVVLAVALELKLDWTKEKELLLWYSEYESNNVRVRKHTRLFKF